MANPNSIEAICVQFAEQISATMAAIIKEVFPSINTHTKPQLEHQRKVLICGYTEEEDCVCIEASSKWSVCNDIDDDDGVALVCEEEEKSSVEDPLEQSFKNSKEQFIEMDERQVLDAMTTEREGDYEEDDHEEFQAKIDDPNPPVHQVCVESIHDKVISVSHSDFSSPSLSNNTAVGTICANKKGFLVADNIFDKSSERDGYSVELKPKPPDAYNSLNNLIMYGFNATTEPKTKESIYQCLISVAANNQQPSHWFSPYTVHRWEGQVVPHYFSGKLMNHAYMECWNRIAAKYMENPEKRLAVYDSDGLPVGINIDDMTRILHFLDYCGITNSCVAAQNLELREDGYVGLLDLAEDGEFTLLEHSHIVQSVFIDLVLQCNNVPCIDVIIILLVYAVTTGLYHKHYKAAEYGMLLHEYGKETTDAYEVLTSNKKIHFHSPSLQKLLNFLKIAKSVNELMLGERPLVYNDNQFCMGQGYGITNGRWMQWLKMEYFHFDKADVGVTELSDSKSLIFIKRLGSRGINFFGLIVTRFCKKDSDLGSFVNTSLVLINEIHLVNDFCRGALHTIVNRIKVLLLNLGSRLSTPAPALGEETRVVKLNTKGFSYNSKKNSRQRIMGKSSFLKYMPLWLHYHVKQQYSKHFAAMKQFAHFHLEGKVDFKGGSIVMNYFSRMIFGNPTVEIKSLV